MVAEDTSFFHHHLFASLIWLIISSRIWWILDGFVVAGGVDEFNGHRNDHSRKITCPWPFCIPCGPIYSGFSVSEYFLPYQEIETQPQATLFTLRHLVTTLNSLNVSSKISSIRSIHIGYKNDLRWPVLECKVSSEILKPMLRPDDDAEFVITFISSCWVSWSQIFSCSRYRPSEVSDPNQMRLTSKNPHVTQSSCTLHQKYEITIWFSFLEAHTTLISINCIDFLPEIAAIFSKKYWNLNITSSVPLGFCLWAWLRKWYKPIRELLIFDRWISIKNWKRKNSGIFSAILCIVFGSLKKLNIIHSTNPHSRVSYASSGVLTLKLTADSLWKWFVDANNTSSLSFESLNHLFVTTGCVSFKLYSNAHCLCLKYSLSIHCFAKGL